LAFSTITFYALPKVYYHRSTTATVSSNISLKKFQRLQSKVIKLVDISYSGENGFNQAIELAAESLQNVKFIQEKKLIGRYFDEISQDTGKYCFGVEDTLKALELGGKILILLDMF
jgi:peptide chain release factor subunit 1